MDCTLLSWSHSCKGVLNQTDSSQRGFWQMLLSQGNGRYMNWSHQTWEKAGNEKKYLDLHKQILPCSILIYKVDPGQKKSPLQPKQSSTMQGAQQVCWCPCCDLTGASKLIHSLEKWIAMIKENYLCFTLICLVNSHENLENSPCCFPKCLCLRPKLSYSFNPVQEIQDQSWWDFVSSQLFPAPSLEFRQLLVFIPQPWASQIWHFSVNPWFWHEFWTGVLSPENSPALQQMTHLHCGTHGNKLLASWVPKF